MTAIQNELWPDVQETDPKIVAGLYDKSSPTYRVDICADGWDVTYEKMTTALAKYVPAKVEELKASNQSSKLQVLDAGCGDGALGDKFDFSKYGATLHGCDISQGMLDIAKKNGKYQDLKQASLTEKLPYETDFFDFICSNGVLGYVETPAPVYEFLRVLKTGAHFMINMRTMHFQDWGYEKALDELINTGKVKVVDKIFFDPFPNNPAYKHEYGFRLIQKL